MENLMRRKLSFFKYSSRYLRRLSDCGSIVCKNPLEQSPFLQAANVPGRSIIHRIHNGPCLLNEMAKV